MSHFVRLASRYVVKGTDLLKRVLVGRALRSGQLHEQLLANGEHSEPTAESRIVRAVPERPIDPERVESTLLGLGKVIDSGDETELAQRVLELIGSGLASEGDPGLAGHR